jgi:hypothetical protein
MAADRRMFAFAGGVLHQSKIPRIARAFRGINESVRSLEPDGPLLTDVYVSAAALEVCDGDPFPGRRLADRKR